MHLILNDVDRLKHENELMKVAADYHHLHQWLARHARENLNSLSLTSLPLQMH